MRYWMRFWQENSRTPFVSDPELGDFSSDTPIPIPREGEEILLGTTGGVVVKVAHEWQPKNLEGIPTFYTEVFCKRTTGRESGMSDEESRDYDEAILGIDQSERDKRIEALEEKGATWDAKGRFWGLDGKFYDEDGNPM
jgi:hypothetical protein